MRARRSAPGFRAQDSVLPINRWLTRAALNRATELRAEGSNHWRVPWRRGSFLPHWRRHRQGLRAERRVGFVAAPASPSGSLRVARRSSEARCASAPRRLRFFPAPPAHFPESRWLRRTTGRPSGKVPDVPASPQQGGAEVGLALREIGAEIQGRFEVRNRFVRPAFFSQGDTGIGVSFG
jgi:hypothetical protein